MNYIFSFGDHSSFAIQGELRPDIVHSNLKFGKICMVCGGDNLGDNEAIVILNAAANMLKDKVLRYDNALASNLFAKEKVEILNHINNKLENSNSSKVWNTYACLDLAFNTSEAFDGETVIWLTNSKYDRLIWQKFECTEIKEIFLKPGIIVNVITEFHEFITREEG